MVSALTVVSGLAALAWVGLLALPWQPWRTSERLEADASADPDLTGVAVLIPARDEGTVIARTIAALKRQGRGLKIVVVDDQSQDGTAEIAQRAAGAPGGEAVDLAIVRGAALPDGWAGKLWALEQGLERVDRPFVLLLDADIELEPKMLPTLMAMAHSRALALTSIMASLHCETWWERLLVPPFVFFFKLLYPFALANDVGRRTAAAAGGCMLVRTDALRSVGGFAAIRDALIDDCSLARGIKASGHATWVGLSHSVKSLRVYGRLEDFWRMVSRSAFTQLRYSSLLLLAATASMVVVFVGPLVGLAAAAIAREALPAALGGLALAAMAAAYLPLVSFYGRSAAWVLTLPLAAALYLAMTWSSAIGYWRGTRATWKNRSYEAIQ